MLVCAPVVAGKRTTGPDTYLKADAAAAFRMVQRPRGGMFVLRDQALLRAGNAADFLRYARNSDRLSQLIPPMAGRLQNDELEEARRLRVELRLALAQADELVRRAEAVLSRTRSPGPAISQEPTDLTAPRALFGSTL